MINFGGQRNASLQVKEGRRNHNVSFYDFAICFLKLVLSKKATKIDKIFTVDLTLYI